MQMINKLARASIWPIALLAVSAGQLAAAADEDVVWDSGLKAAYFGDRPVVQSDDVIELEAPVRADNAAVVPISIKAKFPQSEDRHIKTIHLFVDKNPGALAGTFRFSPNSGRADLMLRIRVNAYSPVRAVAETSDGELHMSRRYVKASGGCSAPAGADLDAAMARLGKMKMKTEITASAKKPTLAQLMVSHPNINGLQMDQVTQLYSPAHYVRSLTVKFDGEEVFSAETGFAISENPNFRFYFVPQRDGVLEAEVVDTEGLTFKHSHRVALAKTDDGIKQAAAEQP